MSRKFLPGIAALLLLAGVASSQQPVAELPSFEVAAIRPGSHPVSKVTFPGGPPGGVLADVSDARRTDSTHFRAVNADLAELIEWAYRVRTDRISGPGDIKSKDYTFDINATMPAETTDSNARLMLRRLLSERFGVVLHSVVVPTSGYQLVVDRGGPKLKVSKLPGSKGIAGMGASTVRLLSPAARMESLANAISRNLEAPVVDLTHLDGLYDIDIQFSHAGPVESDAPTVFEAIRTLGLRLDKTQIPVESVVVDHANFKPTEN